MKRIAFLVWAFTAGLAYGVDTVLPAPTIPPEAPSAKEASVSDPVLEQGKDLYRSGQYMPALEKFMKVLRRNPKDAEAREYLRLVVDALRNQRQSAAAESAAVASAEPTAAADSKSDKSKSRKKGVDPLQTLRQRQLFTMDLAAIPGVKVRRDSKRTQVEMDTTLLFADSTGGLKEEGVPLLDRVSAWLKTFDQNSVSIHCYPEELADPSLGGSLFLHRYAQLYGFFVDERKINSSRFIAAGSSTEGGKPEGIDVSSSAAKVLIISYGGASYDALNTVTPNPTRWLEFSIISPKKTFNPDEGAWVTMDLAALAPNEAKKWQFRIFPVGSTEPVYAMDGTGNLLKRVSWDGHHQKTGSFVDAGTYVARLSATSQVSGTKTTDISIQVIRSAAPLAKKLPNKKAQPRAAKPAAPAKTVAKAEKPAAAAPATSTQPPAATEPAASAPAEGAAAATPDTEEDDVSADAIWKQVIQFDPNESDLKPTVKASLERIGKTLEVYPLQKVRVTGFAESTEKNAMDLAKQRAERIRETLVTEYRVDPKRILVSGGKIGSSGKAEISITN